ncbi:DNA-directed RNA polymerase subunit beta [Paenibacillus sp. FSL H8-0034]|jgi:hypothetical protein|uniref:DNA-directed RNA polymerase subunit beta n=1 Tax=Paenibacillus sp. FSL H8-0034 TaxID=2954671 RepID=UPI0030F88123
MAEANDEKAPAPAPAPKKKAKVRKKRRRWVVLALQWIGIPLLCIVALGIGLVIGYVYIGKQPMDEVYEFDTWRHLYDLVFAET